MSEFEILGRKIGEDYPPVVIAEIGINHAGSLDVAVHLADEAINAGAEIIKHQTHIIEDEMSFEATTVVPDNAAVSIYDVMKSAALSEKDEYEIPLFLNENKKETA